MVPVIELSGSARERGLAYGRAARDRIAFCISAYTKIFEAHGHSFGEARAIGRLSEAAIRAYAPDYLEEMAAIADGAGVEYEDILALNNRSEVMFMNECTAFAVMPENTAGGHTLIGQTWDFLHILRGAMVILRIEGETGSLILFTEAGLIGGKGMNSHGLGLTLNALKSPFRRKGTLPLHIRMRGALEQPALYAAYNRLVEGEIGCPACVTLAHRDGLAIAAEMTEGDVGPLLPEDGCILHTNYFLTPRFAERDGNKRYGGTLSRQARVNQMLRGRKGVTVEYLKAVLGDHKGSPEGICRHAQNPGEGLPAATNFGLVMDLTAGEAHFAENNPCENPFVTFTL